MTLKRLTAALLLCATLTCTAQEVRITGFGLSGTGCPPDIPVRLDADGRSCAVLRMETTLSGWTFDAGLAGIMDVAYGDGEVRIWVPAGARRLTVSHPQYGALRDWAIPISLQEGCLYTMKLEVFRPAPVQVAASKPSSPRSEHREATPRSRGRNTSATRPVSVPVAAPLPAIRLPEAKTGVSRHFIDVYAGECYEDGEADEIFFGMRYTYLPGKLGVYGALGYSDGESGTIFGGAAFRPSQGGEGILDWQFYAGAGLICGCALGGEAGMRFAWKSDCAVSRWDFGVGCQFWSGCVVPTVEVGLYIWGIPVVMGVGLCLTAF